MRCPFCEERLTPTLDGTGWECRACKEGRWPTKSAVGKEINEEKEIPPQEKTKEAA